ncbi:hypothetical protein [Streptomyces sp. NBC_00059]|uniref:hypothetical protein n=1 Tax=Streptomyces sp. NBC_00059 TaxID=2975635 RepID=UPI00225A6B93|nr:hypothetical protein [Streptomyces sp. NBC_00059]MCX5415622.1 hypothetical protein [Streptomyces sp. NBC_00059]
MSTSDQDQDTRRDTRPDARRDPQDEKQDTRPDAEQAPAQDTGGDTPVEAPVEAPAEAPDEAPDEAPGNAPEEPARDPGADEVSEPAAQDERLTPRQARRLRIVLSSVGMAAMAVVLALRIASRSSVLVVGVYGLALILCGVVIELSRNGRTRLGSWLLGFGLVAAIGADWLLIP